ncbi:MAG: DNA polymerase III subunit [Gemmatimonadaceae bacterium]
MPLLPVFGHEHLRDRLRSAFERGGLPQSILLHGEEGIGKQRVALWLGQLLLCASDARPCGQCQHCRFVLNLSHPDLLWVFPRPRLKDGDAAPDEVKHDIILAGLDRAQANGLYEPPLGNEGIYVPAIRLLVQLAAITPALAKRKVFVVGDCDRMVPQEGADQAANAFLKLLEEPPADTVLILTTSAPGALLPTIRSRVVSLRMAPISSATMREWASQDVVKSSLDKMDVVATVDARIRLAAGAPGRLVSAASTESAAEKARLFLEVAAAGNAERKLRFALSQGSAGARGNFSDILEALTVALHDRARAAVEASDENTARNAARAVALVEESKLMAGGNVNPQLISASLLDALSRALSA